MSWIKVRFAPRFPRRGMGIYRLLIDPVCVHESWEYRDER